MKHPVRLIQIEFNQKLSETSSITVMRFIFPSATTPSILKAEELHEADLRE
jgi:hypothetical protein